MNGKDIAKYSIGHYYDFLADPLEEETQSNDLEDIIKKAEIQAKEKNRDQYVSQLIRIVKPIRPEVETETIVVK